MIPRDQRSPTIPIPFQRYLKVVAIVDEHHPQVREFLDQLAAENYQVEIGDSFDRDVTEDADVGAYIASVDADNLEKARALGRAVRAAGFYTPLWALANAHRIADLAVVSLTVVLSRLNGVRQRLRFDDEPREPLAGQEFP